MTTAPSFAESIIADLERRARECTKLVAGHRSGSNYDRHTAAADAYMNAADVVRRAATAGPMTMSEELEQVTSEIAAAEERRIGIYRRSIEAPEAEKVCADWMAKMITDGGTRQRIAHGWLVDSIVWKGTDALLQPSWRASAVDGPTFVAVRPCDPRFGGKTYLGVLLGDFPISLSCTYGPGARVLEIEPVSPNPCIFMPDVGEVVFGCSSWWGQIESPEQLRQITTADIDSVWYVRALKAAQRPASLLTDTDTSDA